jgi:hypothetical protein
MERNLTQAPGLWPGEGAKMTITTERLKELRKAYDEGHAQGLLDIITYREHQYINDLSHRLPSHYTYGMVIDEAIKIANH